MPIYVKYDENGTIESVCITQPDDAPERPFGPDVELFLRVDNSQERELDKLEASDIHDKYRVDVNRKRLVQPG